MVPASAAVWMRLRAFHAVGKELVDAQQGLPLVDREAEMLVHLILLIVVRSR